MMTKIAIIGDNFMLPEMFEDKIRTIVGGKLEFSIHRNNWPGDPLVHGHTTPGVDGLKEYFGDEETVIRLAGEAQVLVTHLAPVSARVLDGLPDLGLIVVSRGGPVNVNLAACRERNIAVANTPGRNASAVAEFTIGTILVESRKIRTGHEQLKQGHWADELYRADTTGRELKELTVGVIGYGAIGRLVVDYLKPFGCKILVSDPFATLTADHREQGAVAVDLDELLLQSDVVTLHTKVTPETVNMINADTIAKMKNDAILINTTRGSLCDEAALAQALANGGLGGAALDTYRTEPLPESSPFFGLSNVTLTPHIAGASVYTVSFAAEMAAREVKRYLNGEPLKNSCW